MAKAKKRTAKSKIKTTARSAAKKKSVAAKKKAPNLKKKTKKKSSSKFMKQINKAIKAVKGLNIHMFDSPKSEAISFNMLN